MSRKHMVHIEKDSSLKDYSISLPKQFADEAGLPIGHKVSVSFGVKSILSEVIIQNTKEKRIKLSPSLCNSLHCPTGLSLHVKKGTDELKIGPVLGIFAPRFGIGRFGPHTPYIRSLTRYSRRMGIWTYVFSANDIDFEAGTTVGYYLSSGHWRKGRFPLPDVCYDRIPSRKIEAISSVIQAKEKLRSMPDVICFNDRFMDKWRVHRELSENSIADPYLPKTKRYESSEDLQNFLSKYRKVYIKPTGGSQGHGIIKVTREGGERFTYIAAGRGHGSVKGYQALASRLSRYIGSRRYIIQQGLNLATAGGRHFDIRLLMQKDSTGKWHITKGYARVAAPGRITSNISTGAEGLGMSRILRRAFGRRARTIVGKVRSAGMKLAPVVEKELGQNLGELGIDIGVDTSGKVWLIEVNSKPFRHMTTETGSKLEIIRSVIRPLSYTLGLSGFHKMRIQPNIQANGGEDSEAGI